MIEQLEIPLFKQPLSEDVQRFVELLDNNGRWLTAKDLMELTDWNERQIRSIAEQSIDELVTGNKGYRHIRHATKEEIQHCANRLESQGQKMLNRASAIRRRLLPQ